jgi:hypothetical protein
MPKYRYVGTVASEVAMDENIVPIGPGDFVTMSAEQYEAATENGLAFLEVDAAAEKANASTAAKANTADTTATTEGGEQT